MLAAVADTHIALWYLYGDKRLSSTAKSLIDRAGALGRQIGISSITLAELVYLRRNSGYTGPAYRSNSSIAERPAHQPRWPNPRLVGPHHLVTPPKTAKSPPDRIRRASLL
jgi:PIN domain nuclease of toxin-antitoxin system